MAKPAGMAALELVRPLCLRHKFHRRRLAFPEEEALLRYRKNQSRSSASFVVFRGRCNLESVIVIQGFKLKLNFRPATIAASIRANELDV